MAATASRGISIKKSSEAEKIFNFSPERLKAPFALRCAAISIDYILLLAFPVGWLTLARLLGDTGSASIGTTVWLLGLLLFFANFLILPRSRGQTIGKMLTGLTIVNVDGTKVKIDGLVRRNILGYFLTVMTLGIGFLIAAFNSTGRSLHDFVAGTVVIRGRKILR